MLALISSCIDEGDYDPAEDYIKDPFCRRTMHTASLAINEIDTLRARVDELEADRDRWKTEALAARTCLVHGNRGQPIETYEAWKSARAANREVSNG